MHFLIHSVCMTQVTIRRVEASWVAKAKADAAERGVSMNQVLVDALQRGLGVGPEKKTNGLERFAGTMRFGSPEEEACWERFLNEDLNEIHPEDWS